MLKVSKSQPGIINGAGGVVARVGGAGGPGQGWGSRESGQEIPPDTSIWKDEVTGTGKGSTGCQPKEICAALVTLGK